MQRLARDIRFGARTLRANPGFAATAILTLALGIGLSTAVFTVADALLFRRLPVRDQSRLVVLWGEGRRRDFDFPFAYRHARDLARRTRALESVAFFGYEGAWPVPIRDGDQTTRLRQVVVSGNFFDVLGAHPALGRTLRSQDDVVGATPVVVLSHGAWERQFGGDPRVVGRHIDLLSTGVATTIVGVMPQGLDYPRGVDFWSPVVPSRTKEGTDSTDADVDLVGRLAPGRTAANAQDEIRAFYNRAEASPMERAMHGVARPLDRTILGDVRPALFVFVAAVGLLLLITCINVANLLLVRGLARSREVAVRSALGATRAQVVAQLLAENVLIAVLGSVLGLVVAACAIQGFVAFAPADLPRLDGIHFNVTALAWALGVTIVATLLFGLAPAMATAGVAPQEALRSGARHGADRRSRIVREVLIAGQVALAVVVLSAAALIGRSLVNLETAKLAFESSHLLIGDLAIRFDQFDTQAKQLALIDEVVARVRAMPDVRAVSPVVAVPFSGSGGWDGNFGAPEQSAAERATNPMVNMEVVVPDYFSVFSIPILRGRGFTEDDAPGAAPVIIVSEGTARHYWPGENAVGKHLDTKPGATGEDVFTVVGVVADTRYRDLRQGRPTVYFPLRQTPFPFVPTTLAIRTRGAPAALVPSLRRIVAQSVPGVALASGAPFESYLTAPLAQPRLNALLLAVFGAAAVALAAVGLFGVMATMVRQRARELGLRMALGATAGDIRGMVMWRGVAIASAGTGLGLAGALATNRLLATMLYDIGPTDGVTLVAVMALLLATAAIATAIPARTSTRIDPAIALRADG